MLDVHQNHNVRSNFAQPQPNILDHGILIRVPKLDNGATRRPSRIARVSCSWSTMTVSTFGRGIESGVSLTTSPFSRSKPTLTVVSRRRDNQGGRAALQAPSVGGRNLAAKE
jgi:hypothetical protein